MVRLVNVADDRVDMQWVTAFAAGLDPAARADAATGTVAARLSEAVLTARAAWPRLRVDPVEFVRYIGERLPPEVPVLEGLDGLHVADLYLAFACAHRDGDAIATLESTHRAAIESALGRVELGSQPSREDLQQSLRLRLFVGDEHGAPAITSYKGRGPLGAWLHVTVLRAALNASRSRAQQRAIDDGAVVLHAIASDPEFDYLKGTYRQAFTESFAEAIATLEVRERALLKHAIIGRLNVRQIGRIYGVHFTTAARWVAQAKRTLADETRRRLVERLHILPTDVESVIAKIESRIELDLSTLFAGSEH